MASMGSLSQRLDSLYSISDRLKVVSAVALCDAECAPQVQSTIDGSEESDLTAGVRRYSWRAIVGGRSVPAEVDDLAR